MRALATVAILLTLTACSNDEPEPTPTPSVSVTKSATPTPEPAETPSADEPRTPAEMAKAYREDQPINAPWRFPVTGISEKDGVADVLTTLTPSTEGDLAVDVCGEVHVFLLDRAGGYGRVQVRVRDADLRVVADNLDGRCKAT